MQQPRRKTERIIIRIFLAGFLILAAIGGATALGFHFFQQWQDHRLAISAAGFLKAGNLPSAAFTAQRILQHEPNNADASRIMAQVTLRNGDRTAVDWQQRVVRSRPNAIDDQISLARIALEFHEVKTAETALRQIESKAGDRADYHDALGQLAVAKKNPKQAEAQYAEAARLDPANNSYQLNLAVFRLQSSDAGVRLQASQFLQKVLDDKTIRAPAARALLDYAVQRRDPAAVQIAEFLRGLPEATFRDRIKCAQLFQILHLPEFTTALSELENEAAADSNKTTDLLSWMSSNNLALLAIDWTKSLPAQLVQKRPVFVAIADCYVALSDWSGLKQHCAKADWLDLEFLRHAYLALAFRKVNDSLDADLEWSRALKNASDSERVYALVTDADKWGWTKEAADLLWSLERDPQRQRSALAALDRYYSDLGDTGNLLRVAARMAQLASDDMNAQNNFAQLSLLLNANRDRAEHIAFQLHDREPGNPVFASTYAFALYLRGKPTEAVRVMQTLTPDQLKQPSIAAYYGVFLAAAGQKAQSDTFLEIGRTAQLLPEEKSLLENAQAANR